MIPNIGLVIAFHPTGVMILNASRLGNSHEIKHQVAVELLERITGFWLTVENGGHKIATSILKPKNGRQLWWRYLNLQRDCRFYIRSKVHKTTKHEIQQKQSLWKF